MKIKMTIVTKWKRREKCSKEGRGKQGRALNSRRTEQEKEYNEKDETWRREEEGSIKWRNGKREVGKMGGSEVKSNR